MNEESTTIDETIRTKHDHVLRFPAHATEVNQALLSKESDLDLFCKTGLLPSSELKNPFLAEKTIPAILHPYASMDRLRLPWPLVMTPSSFGTQTEPLSVIIDDLSESLEQDGDEKQRILRSLLQLEALIADLVEERGKGFAQETLDLAETKLSGPAKALEAGKTAATLLASRFQDDTLFVGRGITGLSQLLKASIESVSKARQATFRERIARLHSGLEDLLASEREDSEEGYSAERLEHSTGGSYTRTIDFSSLSHLIDEAPHGTSLGEQRKSRIEHLVLQLSSLSESLFGPRNSICFRSVDEALVELKQRVSDFAALTRAMHVARLEVENQYRTDLHDQLFDHFDYDSIPSSERKAFPPVLVHIHLEGSDHSHIERLFTALGQPGVMRIIVSYDAVCDKRAVPSVGCGLGLQVVARGDTFVEQTTMSDATFIGEGLQVAARCRHSSVLTVYSGLEKKDFNSFLDAAIARDSRAVPSFRFDPEHGSNWAEWLVAEGNEQADARWASSTLSNVEGTPNDEMHVFSTPLDVLALNPGFERHFVLLDPQLASDKLIPVTEYLSLQRMDQSDRYPFLWVRNEQNWLLKCVPGPSARRYARDCARSWNILREWSGLESSILETELEKSKKASQLQLEEAIQNAQAEFNSVMKEKTSTLAHQIVENIAASLLGVSSTQVSAPPPRPTAETPEAPAELTSKESDPQPPAEVPPTEVVVEEDEPLLMLDDAYIDTPLCTSCNECTDLNGLIFGYDENKQAFIKDAAAGPFRDLVLGAEHCPVHIIHPGKPLDPSENHLDEWVERAKPFN